MIKILFICHGNICRSPMAEFVMKDSSRLAGEGISTAGKYARQMTKEDYREYDYLIGMDRWNLRSMERITGPDREVSCPSAGLYQPPEDEIADPLVYTVILKKPIVILPKAAVRCWKS